MRNGPIRAGVRDSGPGPGSTYPGSARTPPRRQETVLPGRRQEGTPLVPRLPRRLVPRAVAAAVALVGALLIGLGALFATTLAPDREVTARLDGIGRQPVVTTQIGLLDLAGPRVRVQAVADGKPVFLGIGRAKDVEAYLDKVSRLEVVGHHAQGGL